MASTTYLSLRCVINVIMAPSPPSSEIMPKHYEDLGSIGKKYTDG
jgi:hypothetical protein